MNKKFTAGLGNVKVVLKEFLNGEKGFLVEAFDGTFFENFFEEHFAKGGGKLINKSCNTKIIIADDGFVGIENFSDFKSNLCFFKALCKIFDSGCSGTDTYVNSGEEFASESINDGTCKFFKICDFDAGSDLFNKNDIGFAYAENKVFGFIREEILDNIKNGDIVCGKNADEENNSRNIGGEAKFPCFDINIAGKDVIENYVFNKVCAVIFFIIILFDSCKRNCHKGAELCGKFIGACNKNRKFGFFIGTEGFICKSVANMTFLGGTEIGYKEIISFAGARKVTASYNRSAIINNADSTTDTVMHLVYYTLK